MNLTALVEKLTDAVQAHQPVADDAQMSRPLVLLIVTARLSWHDDVTKYGMIYQF